MRKLFEIANEIAEKWSKVNYAAAPYLDAMFDLNTVHDYYGDDRGDMIVAYFLSTARTWRGEDAKRIKAELRAMIA